MNEQTQELSSTPSFEPKLPEKPGKGRRRVEGIRGAYYRKPKTGYIHYSYGPETRQAQSLINKGHELLLKYSWTNKTRDDGSPLRIDYEADEHPNPYYWFIKNGGAPEFPLEQVIEHGWDVNPPFGLPVEAFPQLKGNMPVRWQCSVCGPERMGFIKEQHLRNHLRVGHQLRMNEVAEEIKIVKEERAKQPDA
jgi:hypothetical protein